MTRALDDFLDYITMYRLVLYHLVALLAAAFVFGFFGIVPHDPTAIAFSAVLLVAVCWITNWLFARVFDVPANSESTYITALILVLIVDPVTAADAGGVGALLCIAVWAIASKFVFAVGRKHLFNPAALAVVLSGFLLDYPATWWVAGNLALLPVVLIGGFLIVRKLQRFDLVLAFILAVLATVLAGASPSAYGTALRETLLSSPLFFFASVMLTEPLTAPTARMKRLAFGILVGFLFAPDIHVGSFYFTPELALLAGNLFAYLANPKGRFLLTLEHIERAAADTYDFVFTSEPRLAFRAGQYLEWTLGIQRPDNRGNRRYFTVASSPTEDTVRLGVKFHPSSSAFKRALGAMVPGDRIYAAQLAGSFTLPTNRDTKLAFLAGGIGITPFRSMLQALLDRGEARQIVVLYGNEREGDIAYRDVLDRAGRELGIRTFYAVAWGAGDGHYPGFIDARLIRDAIPDFPERTFYVSGPQAMVEALRRMLLGMGVRQSRIKTDYFPGFA